MTDSKHDSEISDDDVDDLAAPEVRSSSGLYSIAAPLTEVADRGRRMREAEDAEVRGENVWIVFHLPDGTTVEQEVRLLLGCASGS
jgi:hypothetical protein